MTDALRYEVVRLRTLRSTWWLLGTSLVVSLGIALLFAALSRSHSHSGDLVPAVTALAAQAVPVQALLAGLVGAFAIGHEHRYGTIRLTLAVLPRRGEVLAAKVVVVGAWAVLVALACLAVAFLGAVAWPGSRLLHDPVGGHTLARVLVGFVVLSLLYALIGMALAGLLRNLPGAVVLLVVWPLVVENILVALTFVPGLAPLRPASKYLPFGAGQQLLAVQTGAAANGSGPPGVTQLSPWEGGGVFALLAVVLLAAWWAAFRSSDA